MWRWRGIEGIPSSKDTSCELHKLLLLLHIQPKFSQTATSNCREVCGNDVFILGTDTPGKIRRGRKSISETTSSIALAGNRYHVCDRYVTDILNFLPTTSISKCIQRKKCMLIPPKPQLLKCFYCQKFISIKFQQYEVSN